jgi:hypothetical protein
MPPVVEPLEVLPDVVLTDTGPTGAVTVGVGTGSGFVTVTEPLALVGEACTLTVGRGTGLAGTVGVLGSVGVGTGSETLTQLPATLTP